MKTKVCMSVQEKRRGCEKIELSKERQNRVKRWLRRKGKKSSRGKKICGNLWLNRYKVSVTNV